MSAVVAIAAALVVMGRHGGDDEFNITWWAVFLVGAILTAVRIARAIIKNRGFTTPVRDAPVDGDSQNLSEYYRAAALRHLAARSVELLRGRTLTCSKCGASYRLGVDAITVSLADVLGAGKKTLVMGAIPSGFPIMVGRANSATPAATIQESLQKVQALRGNAGWCCELCGSDHINAL